MKKLKWSKLGIINFLLIQWFWVRICKVKYTGGETRWGILFPIAPMTGWWSSYIPAKHKLFKVRK